MEPLSTGARDILKLVFLNLVWSITAVLGALVDLPSIELVLYRTAIACIGLFLIVKTLGIPQSISRVEVIRIILTGAVIGAHWILFFLAVELSTVSICLVALATTSLITSFLKPLFHEESKPTLREILFAFVVVIAVATIFGFETDHSLGFAAGLGSAVCAALFNLLNSRFAKRYDHRVIASWEMLGAAIFCALCLPLSARWLSREGGFDLIPNGVEWLWLGILAIVCTIYSYTAYVELLKRLSAFTVALYSNLEPVFGIALGVILFQDHQQVGPAFMIGAAVILVTLIAYTATERPAQERSKGSPV